MYSHKWLASKVRVVLDFTQPGAEMRSEKKSTGVELFLEWQPTMRLARITVTA
jgi:hypothetical protein